MAAERAPRIEQEQERGDQVIRADVLDGQVVAQFARTMFGAGILEAETGARGHVEQGRERRRVRILEPSLARAADLGGDLELVGPRFQAMHVEHGGLFAPSPGDARRYDELPRRIAVPAERAEESR